MLTYKNFILEKLIAKKIAQVEIDLITSYHSEERLLRHKNEIISEEEIVSTINNALNKIIEDQIFDSSIGQQYLIYNKNTDLNVIGQLVSNKSKLIFVVITVMRKRNFIPHKNTKKISV